MTAAANRTPGRREELLLAQCAVLDDRPSVAFRLRRLLGPDLTRLLLVALTAELHKPVRF
jgi:hypothetical protein